jgi:heme exporter protein C
MKFFYDLIKPKHFFNFTNTLTYIFIFFTLVLFTASLYLGIIAPSDLQQGLSYKIIYIHVPSAWLSLLLYTIVAINSLFYLINKNIFLFLIAKNFARIGIHFTIITLITGSLWGKPMWGTYWVWDARLTSMLILFFLYLGYIILIYSYEDQIKAMNNSSILALIGLINIPIIKYSVEWWNTLHQSSSVTKLGSSIHVSMLIPLLTCFFCLCCITILILFLQIRKDILKQKIENLYMN